MPALHKLALLPLISLTAAVPARADDVRLAPVVSHTPHILGCSLDLQVATDDPALADAVRELVLASLESTRCALDVRLADSAAAGYIRGEDTNSPALRAVLDAYSAWEMLTGGAVSARTGALSALWADAARSGREPASAEIAAAREAGRAAFNSDALGKAFAAEAAARAVEQIFPELPGFLINIGGDIVCRGVGRDGLPWRVGVASPDDDAYNARAVDRLSLTSGAVVTSGDAHRAHVVGERRLSHVINPLTGLPAAHLLGATVLASDAVTANALTCALCVLGEKEGLALVERTSGASARVTTRGGEILCSSRWPGRTAPHLCGSKENKAGGKETADKPADPAWPDKMRFRMTLNVGKAGKRNPYIAVWVTDAKGELVRSLALWGTKAKYARELKTWWTEVAKSDASRVASLSKATHKPGSYVLEWDGRDENGKLVAPGEYTVHIETAQEHVGNYSASGKITCKGSTAAKVTLDACGKTLERTTVHFAPGA